MRIPKEEELMSENKPLKQRIQEGEVLVSLRLSVDTNRPQLETILSQGTYDFIYVDGQHTAFSDDQLVTLCATAEELGLPVQFRIPHTRHAYLIGRYLDLGLTGILVPQVETEADVEEAIAQCYYPQIGRRSWGGKARLGLKRWGRPVDRREYASWWNRQAVLAVQYESVSAINLSRRLARPGIDYVAFGPNDLLFNMEGQPDNPFQNVDAAMRHTAGQLQDSGIRLGMAVPTIPGERDKYLQIGITVFQEDPPN
jgi:2-keto-3-deoxy-L-rhamnonate aldolase RhmA